MWRFEDVEIVIGDWLLTGDWLLVIGGW